MATVVGVGGGLVCESVGNAVLLSDHFDGNQSRLSVDLPLTDAFRSSEVRGLILDLGPDFRIVVMLINGAVRRKQNLSNVHEFVVC